MYVAHGVVALEVAGQMADVLSALKRATQQAVRESRYGVK